MPTLTPKRRTVKVHNGHEYIGVMGVIDALDAYNSWSPVTLGDRNLFIYDIDISRNTAHATEYEIDEVVNV